VSQAKAFPTQLIYSSFSSPIDVCNAHEWCTFCIAAFLLAVALSHFELALVTADWAVATMSSTGYGDIVPITHGEATLATCVMFAGLVWSGFLVASMTQVLYSIDRSQTDLTRRQQQLEFFMRDARLPRELKARILDHFDKSARYDEGRASHRTREMLDMLSPAIRQEVVLMTNKTILVQIPLLRHERPAVQSAVLERLKKGLVAKGEYLFMEGMYATSMAFLTRGVVNVYQGKEKIVSLGEGSFVGAVDCLFSSVRLMSVQAVTDVEIYFMDRKDVMYVLGEHLAFGSRLKRKCLLRLERFGRKINRSLVEPEFLVQMQQMGIGVLSGMDVDELEQTLNPLRVLQRQYGSGKDEDEYDENEGEGKPTHRWNKSLGDEGDEGGPSPLISTRKNDEFSMRNPMHVKGKQIAHGPQLMGALATEHRSSVMHRHRVAEVQEAVGKRLAEEIMREEERETDTSPTSDDVKRVPGHVLTSELPSPSSVKPTTP